MPPEENLQAQRVVTPEVHNSAHPKEKFEEPARIIEVGGGAGKPSEIEASTPKEAASAATSNPIGHVQPGASAGASPSNGSHGDTASPSAVQEASAAGDECLRNDADAAPPGPNSLWTSPSDALGIEPEDMTLKGLPKVAAGAARQAGQAYVSAGKEAGLTLKQILSLRRKDGPPVTITLNQAVTALFLILVGLQLLLIPLFMPSVFRLVYSVVWGLGAGLALSFMFYYNKKRKAERNELLGTNLGLKGVQLVAGGLPVRFNASDTEKMEWLNALIVEVWPFVDKGVCQMIKDITAQTMPGVLASLPAGLSGVVKSIGFKHLTFGNAPVRVESIWVSPDDKDSLVLELSVKWCGDPNITLAIEIPGGQKLCPRIMDITFAATVRVVLNPLVPRLPGFVALMATMPSTPLIKYRLDFGKALGGSLAPAAVTPVVNYFVRGIIEKMLVWPQRIVVPILQETEQDKVEIQKLLRRHRGLLRVCVVRAKNLREAPGVQVHLTTDSEHFESTSTQRTESLGGDGPAGGGDTVLWNEAVHLLVQEPGNQLLRLEARHGRTLLGRAQLRLGEVCKAGARGRTEPVASRVHLGTDEWGSPGGPGKGAGRVLLQMSYFPFENIMREQVLESKKGIVTVRLLGLRGLKTGGNSLSVAVAISTLAEKREGKSSWKIGRKTWTLAAYHTELKAQIQKLEQARERDLRDGREADAAAKAAQIAKRNQAIAGGGKDGPMAKFDYSMDANAVHAFYGVEERIGGSEHGAAHNAVVIKVGREGGGGGRSHDAVCRAEIPMSDIRNACDFNPMTGKREYGFYMRKWEGYNPEQPGVEADEAEWGTPLTPEGRIWLELRWVPCTEAAVDEPLGDDDVVDGRDAAAA